MKHIEMYDCKSFCGEDSHETSGSDVDQRDWHEAPEAVQASDCPACLLRVFMLGDSAAIALNRMGMKVEARDATAEELNPS